MKIETCGRGSDRGEAMSKVLDHPSRNARDSSGGSGGNDLSNRLTRVETILENTPTQQDIGDVKASIETVKTLIAEKESATHVSLEALRTMVAEKESATHVSLEALRTMVAEKESVTQASIEAVKTLIAEKQTSALRWSIVTLAGAVAALAGLIVAFRP
jgi:hypothetical protein